MSYHHLPTESKGKTWIFFVQAIVFGVLATFALILGPLSLFEIIKDVRGQPATDAGVALTIMRVPFLLVFALAVFNIAARRRPLLRICREGLEINMIGSSSLDGTPLIPVIVRVAWLILSFQSFKAHTLRAPWQSLHHAEVLGPPMAQTLTIIGAMFRVVDQQCTEATPAADHLTFPEASFRVPLGQIADAINEYRGDAESRAHLSSWCE